MSDDIKSEVGTAFGHETTQLLAVCMRGVLQMTDAFIEKGIIDRCKAKNIPWTPEVRRTWAERAWAAIGRQNRKAQHDFMTRVVNDMPDVFKLYKESLMIFILSKYSAMPNAHLFNIDYHIPDIQGFLFRFMCKAGREETLWAGLKEISILDQMTLVKTLLRMVFLDVIRDANCIPFLKNPKLPTAPPNSDFPAIPAEQQQQQVPLVTAPILPPQQEADVADSADNLSAHSVANPFIKTDDIPVLDKNTTPAQVAAALAIATGDVTRDVLVPPGIAPAGAPAPPPPPPAPPSPTPSVAPAAETPAAAPATATPAAAALAVPAPSTDVTPPPPAPPPSPAKDSDAKALSMTGGEAGSSASTVTGTTAASNAFSFPTDVPGVTLLKLNDTVENAQQFVPALPLAAPEAVAKYTTDGAGGITAKDREDNGLHLPLSDTSFGSEMRKIATIMPEQVTNVITMNTPTPVVKPDDSITNRLPGPMTVSTPVVPGG